MAQLQGMSLVLKRLGTNSRAIEAKVGINASLETIWKIMTDYENFVNIIPNVIDCKVLDKKHNFVRIHKTTEHNFPLGIKVKVNTKQDFYEKDLEILDSKQKRGVEYKVVESALQNFDGKWYIEEVIRGKESDNLGGQKFETTLLYFVDLLKPKPWVPVSLIEGVICKEIQTNLHCIREGAEKMTRK